MDSTLVRVVAVVREVSFRDMFRSFDLVREVQTSLAYVRGIVWEVQRGTASVGFHPDESLGKRGSRGSPNKVKSASIAIG